MFFPPDVSVEDQCRILGVPTPAQCAEEDRQMGVWYDELEAAALQSTDAVAEFVQQFGPHWSAWPKPVTPKPEDLDIPF